MLLCSDTSLCITHFLYATKRKVFRIENEDNDDYNDKYKAREVKEDKEELGVKVLQRASPPPAERRDL